MAGFAIVCPEASIIIAAAINIVVAVPAAPAEIARTVFRLRIVVLLPIAPNSPAFHR
jgi:hypothetical protein